jgi:molybdopterin molybdotransferase
MAKVPPLALAEAQARLIALAPQLATEHRDIADCAGFFLTEPLWARRDQPAAPCSAMDGYALRGADLPGPWRVIGESAAGRPFGAAVGMGEAVRISTGAVVPPGADAVLLQEDCARAGDTLALTGEAPSPPGRHIRPQAMDFASGSPLLSAGTWLGPAQLALAITAGHHFVPVRREVRVAVIDSGDELAMPGDRHDPARLPASNGPMLAAMIAGLPARVVRRGPVPDNLESLVAVLGESHDADVVVTSGGASVGDHDLIRPALAAIGAELEFWRVAIKPGKPLLVARRGQQVILGLPGNPASAFVTGYLFMLPLLRAALGATGPLPRAIPSVLGAPMAKGGSRTEFIRGVWDGARVYPDPLQDSGALTPLARANALILREANAPASPIGAAVTAYLLANGGMA